MAFLAPFAPLIGGALGLGASLLSRPKVKDQPRVAQVTRDEAAREAARSDALAKRRGAAADRITGASGEPVGGLGKLVMGS